MAVYLVWGIFWFDGADLVQLEAASNLLFADSTLTRKVAVAVGIVGNAVVVGIVVVVVVVAVVVVVVLAVVVVVAAAAAVKVAAVVEVVAVKVADADAAVVVDDGNIPEHLQH